jgi:hypothetical protein
MKSTTNWITFKAEFAKIYRFLLQKGLICKNDADLTGTGSATRETNEGKSNAVLVKTLNKKRKICMFTVRMIL